MSAVIVAVDFDGTCVTYEYPNVGKEIGAAPILKKMTENGVKIVLCTMRDGKLLEDAVKWFSDNNIPLYGINKTPGQYKWTTSPKIFANYYIDDSAIGTPLLLDTNNNGFVDWEKMKPYLETYGLL